MEKCLERAQLEGWADEWVRGPADMHALRAGCYFDAKAAERVRQFFTRFLRHSTGKWAGQPFTLLPWQWETVIGPLFGWKRADGSRRFRTGYLSAAKKNGKTGLLSGLALYLTLADAEAGAEVYSAAADRDQASLIFREAAKMIDASPALQRVARYKETTKTIIGPAGSFYRALSADSRRQEGRNASAILFDELHAQQNRELWDALRYAGASRRQPLVLAITTAGSFLESICGEQYQYGKLVMRGDIDDPSFFACIHEGDPTDNWEAETTWHKANPSLGVTINLDDFRADFMEAKSSPAKEASFRRYRLNQWVQTADAWLSMDRWDASIGTVDPAQLAGRECYAGLDLSSTDDTTALVLLFPRPAGQGVIVLPFFWLPKDNIARLERKHRVPYQAWAKQGLLRLTPGNVVDYALLRQQVREEIGATYKIKQLAIDRKFQGQGLESDLIADGFDVVPAGQGWVSQDLPAKEAERLINAGWLEHGGNPILRWHASNAVVDIDKAGNYSLNKRKARSKIDGMAALLMGMMLRMNDHKAANPLPYMARFPTCVTLP